MSSGWLSGLSLPPLAAREPIPPLDIAVPSIILFLSSTASSRLLNWALFPVLVYYALWTPLIYTTGDPPGDFGVGTQGVYLMLTAIDRMLLSKVEVDFKKGKEEAVPPPWTLERFAYSFKLLFSLRGVTWEWQSRNSPSTPPFLRHRGRYLLNRLGRIFVAYIAIDISSAYMQLQPYFHRQVSFASLPCYERWFDTLCAGIAAVGALNLLYDAFSLVAVASFLWTPEECPALFGDPKEAYSLRGLWGKSWHQALRRVLSQPAIKLCKSLGISSHSNVGQWMTLWSSFALSGVQHGFGMLAMNRTGAGSFLFFFIQPVGIVIEGVARAYAPATLRLRGLGYMWTLAWMLLTAPFMIDELVQGGMWMIDPAPFSFARGLITGKWWKDIL